LIYYATLERLNSALNAPEVGSSQLSVGLGGDIPIFPPIALLSLTVLGFILKLVMPTVRVLPKRLDTLSFRSSAFVVGLGVFVGCVKLTEEAFRANATEVNFAAVSSLCTQGILGIVRNPIYSSAMFLLVPGLIIASNSLYMLFTQMVMASYMVFHVVPTEEGEFRRLRVLEGRQPHSCTTQLIISSAHIALWIRFALRSVFDQTLPHRLRELPDFNAQVPSPAWTSEWNTLCPWYRCHSLLGIPLEVSGLRQEERRACIPLSHDIGLGTFPLDQTRLNKCHMNVQTIFFFEKG
jgi:protein-S-isoprenylcysteine O-methyltransferase Ste14